MKSINSSASKWFSTTFLFGCLALAAAPVIAVPVFVPDNGFGTARVPILADYQGQVPMLIDNGPPPGATISINAVLKAPTVYTEVPGGGLGGTKAGGGSGGLFTWQMTGTGALLGFNRAITFPVPAPNSVLSFPDPAFNVVNADTEIHTAPRTNGTPLQSFDTDMFRLFSQITGDPDFDLLRVVAGTDFGLPSPGHTTLLQSGPNWQVDSFFDITYRIDFVGHPGSILGGMSGSSTHTARFSLGDPISIVPEPASCALAGIGIVALAALIRRPQSRRRD